MYTVFAVPVGRVSVKLYCEAPKLVLNRHSDPLTVRVEVHAHVYVRAGGM